MKKTKLPKIVVIAIFSLITAIVWAFFDISRSFIKKPDIKVEEAVIEPLDPTLDVDTLTLLEGATFFEEGQIVETVAPSPSVEPSATSTPAPTLEPSPEASDSGQTQGEGGVSP